MRFKRILSFALVCFLLVGMMPVAQATDTNADSKTVQTAAVTDPADTIGAEPTEAPPEGLEDKFASSVDPESEMNPGKDMSDMMAELEEGIAAVVDANQIGTGDYTPFQFNLKKEIEVRYVDKNGVTHVYHNKNLGCHFAGDGDPSTYVKDLTSPDQLIYCLEPFKAFSTSGGAYYDDITGVGGEEGENGNSVWNYFTEDQRYVIGLVLLYGAPNGLWDSSAGLVNPKSVANPNAGYRAATQIILWEFVAGLRSARTPYGYVNNGYTSPTIYYDNALGVSVGADGTDYFKEGYDYIINCLAKHRTTPSFTRPTSSIAPIIQLTGKVTKVTDTNGVLSRCKFVDTADVKFDIDGNVLTITMLGDTVPDTVYSTKKEVPSSEKSRYRLFYSGSVDQRLLQVLAEAEDDPIPAYFKLKAAPGKLEIIKETNTGSTLGGWEISLYRDAACTDLVGTYITENNGKIATGDLEPGTYYAKETNYPSNMSDNSKRFWVMDTEVKKVVVKTAETAKITFTNNFCGFGNFVKTTNAGSGSLAGWIIGLYSDEACKNEIGRYTTDSEGKVSAGLLKPGTYYVKELGHVSFTETQMAFWDMDDAVKTLTIKSGSTSTVGFHNVIGGAGNFRKITNTGKNLGGWIIGLYSDEACTKEIGRYTTGADGFAPTGGLAVGTYYAKEIGHATMTDAQLALWEMDANVKTVVIEMGKTTPIQFINTQKGKFNFRKITNTGTKLDGWIIGLYSDEACTKEIGKYTTGADGYVATEKLTPGTYYAKELGHATMTDAQLAFWELDTEVKTVVIEVGKTTPVQFRNTAYGMGNFRKLTNTGDNLEGWVIGLYSDAECTEKIGEYVTDVSGFAPTGLLPAGTYYAKELGHVTMSEDQLVYWNLDTEVKTVVIRASNTTPIQFRNNYFGKGQFIKSTNTGGNLDGWIIGLYANEACTEEIGRYTTDADGHVTTGLLPAGTYYAKELGHATMTKEQLAYWELDAVVKPVVIEVGKTTAVDFQNNVYGKGSFIKTTNTGGNLDGWIIGLYADEACTEEIGRYTTDADGHVTTGLLAAGTYYAKELGHATMTEEQLAYWELDTEVKTVVIEVGRMTPVQFHNVAYGRIKVIKTTNTGKDLAGWIFDIKDAEENVVETLTTGEDGTATSGKLPAGAYVVTERSNENRYWVCDVAPKNVEVIAGETAEVTVKNEQLGDIKIIKTTNTGNNLAGWTISLYSDPECTSLIGSYITGEDGTITTELLAIGKVYAKETAAPAETDVSWWTMDASIKEITVVAGQTAEVSFHNVLNGCIKVVKTTNTGRNLSGWVFEIKTPYGAVVEVLTTGEDGTATSKALQPGSYVVTERAIGDKFWVCDVTPKNVEVIAGETAEVTVKNEQLGDIKIIKTTNTGNNLAGWTISLYSDPECTSLIGSYITGEDGTITTELLAIGKVYAKETAAPNGLDADWWAMDTSIKEITVVAGQTAEVSFHNVLNGRIAVKKETNTGKDLAGWVFQIKDTYGKVVETLTTGEDGTATSGFLATGSYIVVEQAIEDRFWVCDVTPKNVEVVAGETAEVTVKNEQLGDIKIIKTTNTGMNLGGWTIELYRDEACTDLVGTYVTKFDGTITTELLEEGVYFAKEVDTPYLNLEWWTLDAEVKTVEVIHGQTATVTFNNVQNGKIKVFKHTNTGKDLAGWVFDIKDAEGNIVETLTTDEDGTATSGFLVPAEYTVTERDSEDDFWICDVTPKEVTVQPGKTADLIVKNERMGSIDIKKTTNTGKDLDGWKIALYADYGCTELIGEYVTGEDGTINTGPIKAGTYYLREIAAPEKDSKWWTLDTSLKIVQVVAGQTAEVSFHNVMNGRITVTKETNTGKDLAGWVFQIKNSYGSIVETLTTGEDGTATSGFLAPGSYIVVEQASEDDFWVCDVTPKNVEVIAGETAEVTVKNEQLGKLHLIKKLEISEDDTNGTLEGWQFKITRKSDNEEIGIFTTDKDGLFTTDLLEPGDYLVEELIPEDSAYYCVSENPVTVTVTGGEIAEVTFTNALRPGKIVIYKVNQGDVPLAGAKFLLEWSEDGEHWFPVELNEEVYTVKGGCSSEGLVKGCLVSGEDGIVTFDGLYPSVQYRVTELEAPNGYSLLADYAYVGVLPEDTLLLELTVVNARTYLLPSTGSSGLATVTTFGTVMILMAAAFLSLVIWGNHSDSRKQVCIQRKNR